MNRDVASHGVDGEAAPVIFNFLGEPHFMLPTGADATPRSKRARALAAYLAVARDHQAQRTHLADLFWGDRSETQARGSLRQCLLEVRSALGSAADTVLVSGRETVSLADGWTSDIGEIDRMLRSNDPAMIAMALERAGREVLLGGMFVNEEFDAWLIVARADFDRRLADGARNGLSLAIEAGDGETARRIADEYLARDPGDEDVTILAMRADALRGAAPVAHRRFQRLREYLAAELGATPGQAVIDALANVSVAAAAPPAEKSAIGGPPALLVGPFAEIGFVDDLLHLSGGIREEVVSGLSRFRELKVIVADRTPSILEAPLFGDAANAYALTATLRQTGGKLRVTPVLTRMSDRFVVWSNPVSIEAEGFAAAIDMIVDRIIGAVTPNVERDTLKSVNTGAVYDRYLAAHYESFPTSDHAVALGAARRLEAIIEEAPDLAVAYPPLMRLYNTNYAFTIAGVRCDAERARALELGKFALSLDRGHVHTYTGLGWCQLWASGWDAAAALFEQAVELNPYHSVRLKEAAFGMIYLGEWTRSDELLRRSLEIDPMPNDGYFEDLGLLRLMQGRMAEATSYLDLLGAPSIWGELYAALAATAIGRSDAPALTLKWRRRIGAKWRGEQQMNADALIAWTAYHHPFRHRREFDDFMSLVDGAVHDSFRREAA